MRVMVVMCDYYSNFIEVAHLKSTTSRCVIREMSEVFVLWRGGHLRNR